MRRPYRPDKRLVLVNFNVICGNALVRFLFSQPEAVIPARCPLSDLVHIQSTVPCRKVQSLVRRSSTHMQKVWKISSNVIISVTISLCGRYDRRHTNCWDLCQDWSDLVRNGASLMKKLKNADLMVRVGSDVIQFDGLRKPVHNYARNGIWTRFEAIAWSIL
jgi:hypothetical protein